MLLRHSDYKSVDEVNKIMKTLLSTLQQKLAILAAVFSSKFAPLIGRVISGVRAAEIKVSELSYKHLRSACVTHTQHTCDVAEKQLNPVTETVDCKQLISHVMMRI